MLPKWHQHNYASRMPSPSFKKKRGGQRGPIDLKQHRENNVGSHPLPAKYGLRFLNISSGGMTQITSSWSLSK